MPTATASPGTLANDNSFGTPEWSSPSNAASSNDSRTSVSLSMNSSQYLKVTNFGFALPATANVLGIEVSVERLSTGPVTDSRVRLVKAGTVQTTDKATGTSWQMGSDETVTYGGAADTWSDTFTGSDINDTGFGVVVSAQSGTAAGADIDHISITVTYELVAADSIARQARLLRP